MIERSRGSLDARVHAVAHRPALHGDNRMMPILAGHSRRQPHHEPRLCLSHDRLEGLRRQMVTLVDDDVAVVGDQVIDDVLLDEALYEGYIKQTCRSLAAAGHTADRLRRNAQERRKSLDPLIEELPSGHSGVAPAAKQQGRYVAKVIAARVSKRPPPPPFAYRDPGNLATIGRKCAVIEFPFMTLRGFVAWWIWGVAHIYFLVGVPSPVVVSLRWLWEYLTYGRGARLITGNEHAD